MINIELIKNYKDKACLEKIFDIYGDRLTGFINSMIKDAKTSEDIMMDIFVELLRQNLMFENESQFKAYIYKSAKNRAINHIKRFRQVTELNEEALEDDLDLENKLYKSLKIKKLYEAMDKINIKYRQVLYLSYIDELTDKEIMEVLAKDAKAVKNLKHRAKKKLNSVLKKQYLIFEDKEGK